MQRHQIILPILAIVACCGCFFFGLSRLSKTSSTKDLTDSLKDLSSYFRHLTNATSETGELHRSLRAFPLYAHGSFADPKTIERRVPRFTTTTKSPENIQRHHHQVGDAPIDGLPRLFQEQHIGGGCQKGGHQPAHFWSNITVYDAEKELMRARPNHFLPLPSFDDGDKTHGGLALFRNAFVQGQSRVAKKMPAIYDCAGSIYRVGGCPEKPNKAETFDMIRTSSNNLLATNLPDDHNPDAVTVFIGQLWDKEYFHSQIEVFPKLAYLLPYLTHTKQKFTTTILGPALPKERIDLMLKLLGLGDEINWEELNADEIKFVPKLVVPTATRCAHAQPLVLEEMQRVIDENARSVLANELDALQSKHKLSSNSGPLIVLQQRLGSRQLLNHDLLFLALQREFGNTSAIVVFKGTETPTQTAALHRLAGIIIGPHGAGLSNMIYCPRNATAVIELQHYKGNGKMGSRGIIPCHEITAGAAGLKYKMLVSGGPGEFGDIFTNVDAVLKEVQVALDWLGHQAGT